MLLQVSSRPLWFRGGGLGSYKKALIEMGDYSETIKCDAFPDPGCGNSLDDALDHISGKNTIFQGVIYGNLGIARYFVRGDGNMLFSKEHCPYKADKAKDLGFDIS